MRLQNKDTKELGVLGENGVVRGENGTDYKYKSFRDLQNEWEEYVEPEETDFVDGLVSMAPSHDANDYIRENESLYNENEKLRKRNSLLEEVGKDSAEAYKRGRKDMYKEMMEWIECRSWE